MKKTIIPAPGEPLFKDVKFKTEGLFDVWLKELTYYKFEFKDNGQDLLTIWVHKTGEILHANLQTSVWLGKFVNLNNAVKRKNIQMFIDGKWTLMDYVIANVETFIENG